MVVRLICQGEDKEDELIDLDRLKLFGIFRECSEEVEKEKYTDET